MFPSAGFSLASSLHARLAGRATIRSVPATRCLREQPASQRPSSGPRFLTSSQWVSRPLGPNRWQGCHKQVVAATATRSSSSACQRGRRLIHGVYVGLWQRFKGFADLPWGKVLSVLRFALPVLGINLANPLMSTIDTWVLGRGANGVLDMAALGPGTTIVDSVAFVMVFLSVATINVLSRTLGQGNHVEAGRLLSRALQLAVCVGMFQAAFLGVFGEHLLDWYLGSGASLDTRPGALAYMNIRVFALPAVVVQMVAQAAFLGGLRNSALPLKAVVYSGLLNFGADCVLVLGLDMGIKGAAWATASSQYLAAGLLLWRLKQQTTLPVNLMLPIKTFGEFSPLLATSLPFFLMKVFTTVIYFMLKQSAAELGTVALAANQIQFSIWRMLALTSEPLSTTAQSFVPRYIGRGTVEGFQKAKTLTRVLALMGVGCAGATILAGAAFHHFAPNAFTDDTDVIAMLDELQPAAHLSLAVFPFLLVSEGLLLAGGDVAFLARMMGVNLVLTCVSLAACSHFGVGLAGVWYTIGGLHSLHVAQNVYRLLSHRSPLRLRCGTER